MKEMGINSFFEKCNAHDSLLTNISYDEAVKELKIKLKNVEWVSNKKKDILAQLNLELVFKNVSDFNVENYDHGTALEDLDAQIVDLSLVGDKKDLIKIFVEHIDFSIKPYKDYYTTIQFKANKVVMNKNLKKRPAH